MRTVEKCSTVWGGRRGGTPERQKKNEMGAGEGKKKRNFERSGGGGVQGESKPTTTTTTITTRTPTPPEMEGGSQTQNKCGPLSPGSGLGLNVGLRVSGVWAFWVNKFGQNTETPNWPKSVWPKSAMTPPASGAIVRTRHQGRCDNRHQSEQIPSPLFSFSSMWALSSRTALPNSLPSAIPTNLRVTRRVLYVNCTS